MGLDMYLSAKRYVSKHDYKAGWENRQIVPEFEEIVSKAGLQDFCADPSVDIYGTTVSVNAAYWRKANQIHQWFVDNVQDGNDNCGEYYVSEEQLEELRGVCNEILANRDSTELAEELLPPSDGFFFGSTELDEWYYSDIEYTADRIKQILATAEEYSKKGEYVSFYYQSSW